MQEFISRWGEHKSIIAYYLIAERFSVGHFSLEREGIVTAAREAMELFQQVDKPLAQAQGVLHPEPLERVVLKRFETMS